MSDADAPLVAIVEDDAAIAGGLALNLGLHGYRTEAAADGDAATTLIATSHPDLVLLDISLPRKSGLVVLEELRAAGDRVPIIVLSARQDEFDKVAALQLGADDYVTKPFALAELMARVAAVLRRTRPREVVAAPTELGFGDVRIDLASRIVTRAGAPVQLTHLELELLTSFAATATASSRATSWCARSGAYGPEASPAPSTTSSPSCAPSWSRTPTARSTSSRSAAAATGSSPPERWIRPE